MVLRYKHNRCKLKTSEYLRTFSLILWKRTQTLLLGFRLNFVHKIQESNCVSAGKKDMAAVSHMVIRCLLILGGKLNSNETLLQITR
jgi:hypothetical protein